MVLAAIWLADSLQRVLRGHEFLNPPLGELHTYFGSHSADLALWSRLSIRRSGSKAKNLGVCNLVIVAARLTVVPSCIE